MSAGVRDRSSLQGFALRAFQSQNVVSTSQPIVTKETNYLPLISHLAIEWRLISSSWTLPLKQHLCHSVPVPVSVPVSVSAVAVADDNTWADFIYVFYLHGVCRPPNGLTFDMKLCFAISFFLGPNYFFFLSFRLWTWTADCESRQEAETVGMHAPR